MPIWSITQRQNLNRPYYYVMDTDAIGLMGKLHFSRSNHLPGCVVGGIRVVVIIVSVVVPGISVVCPAAAAKTDAKDELLEFVMDNMLFVLREPFKKFVTWYRKSLNHEILLS